MLQHKCKDMGVNIEDEELVKMFNPILKMRETILFFLIVVINGLTWIISDIGLDTCVRGRCQSKEYCVISLFKLIKFRSIIQFLFMLFPLSLCLHQQVPPVVKKMSYESMRPLKYLLIIRTYVFHMLGTYCWHPILQPVFNLTWRVKG